MGGAVTADCKCGYRRGIFIGTGVTRASRGFWGHPALCSVCKEVVSVNLEAPVASCSGGCTGVPKPYVYTPELQVVPGDQVVTAWREWKLNDGGYLCPSCGEYSLFFSDDCWICWD